MTKPPSFLQQRAVQKKAEREQEYGLTPERIEVLKQLYTILNDEVLPVLAPLEREVCEELGFHLSWNWNAGSTGTLSSTAEDRWDPVPLKPQGVSYEKQVPQVNPGWTGGRASLARLREQLAWLRKTVHGDEDGVPSEIDCI